MSRQYNPKLALEENLSSANKAEATLADIPFKPKKTKKKLKS